MNLGYNRVLLWFYYRACSMVSIKRRGATMYWFYKTLNISRYARTTKFLLDRFNEIDLVAHNEIYQFWLYY